ncbi:MAG: uracil-DNA glycosylase family protein [Actinomycetes bacterium]
MSRPRGPDPHRATLDVYERRAHEWQDQRPPRLDEAVVVGRLAQAAGGPTLDLGCGPGWHLPVLPPGTVAVDGARAMLDLSARRAPTSPGVQADLRALPFRRHAFGAAWANKSFVHLDRRLVPRALWDLHRVVRPDGVAFVSVFMGDAEHETYDADTFPGRSFSLWTEELLHAVVEGSGFDVLDRVDLEDTSKGYVGLTLRRQRALADLVGPGMRLLLVGLNPSLYSADCGVGFGRPGNRAWPALLASGLATADRDPLRLLDERRIGMTDLVKRPTARADELTKDEFRHGVARLELLCRWLQPGAVCVLGLTGWRAAVDTRAVAGVQPGRLGDRPVYLMPNPSGLNAHETVDSLAAHLAAAADLGSRT